MKMYNLQVVV